MAKTGKIYLIPIFSGLIAALSYPPFDIEPLIWFAFVPLLIVAFKTKEESPKRLFFIGSLMGAAYAAVSYSFLWATYPLNFLGIESGLLSFILILFVWTFELAILAVPWGAFFLVTVIVIRKAPTFPKLILIPSIWAVSQYLAAWGFVLFTIGPESIFGPHGTLHNIAYATHNNPLMLRLASFLGIYGVGFVIMLANVALASSRNRKRLIFIILILGVIISSRFWFRPVAPEGDKLIAVIQAQLPVGKDRTFDKDLEFLEASLKYLDEISKFKERAEVIIFPEGSNFSLMLTKLYPQDRLPNYFKNKFPESTLIIDGTYVNRGGSQAQTVYIDSKQGLIGSYAKRFLTPFGENPPYFLSPLAKIVRDNGISFPERGREPSTAQGLGEIKISTFICSELFSPSLVSEVSRNGSNLIVIQASTAWFRGKGTIVEQNKAIAKFRAVENNKFLVLAANFGRSYIINNQGTIIKEVPSGEPQLFTGKVGLLETRTWYNKVGNLIIYLSTAIVIFAVFCVRCLQIRKS